MNCFVKESYGIIWNFYHNSHGICFCKMNDENLKEYNVLMPDGRPDFDVIVDDMDCIHMVCQNKEGDIIYITHFDNKWKKRVLLKTKSPTYYNKDFTLVRVGNWINLFCCIEYNGKRMLTHQVIDREDMPPYVIQCIRGDYSVCKDSMDNIYVIAYDSIKGCYGMKKYLWSKKEWEEHKEISCLENCKSFFAFLDKDDKLHIVYDFQSCIKEYFEGQSVVTGMGQRPIMLYQDENIIMWEGYMDNKIYIKREGDKSPTIYMPGGFSKPHRFDLRYTSFEKISARSCLGNVTNGVVKLYGLNNFFNVYDRPRTDNSIKGERERVNIQDAEHIELQKLKIRTENLERAVCEIENKLLWLEEEMKNRRSDNTETTACSKSLNLDSDITE